MNSIWTTDINRKKRKQLIGEHKTKVAVIGGGMAGILTAYFLAEKGIETIVLEADVIGDGMTGSTTAKITSQHNLLYNYLLQTFGREQAFQYLYANQAAVTEYKRLIHQKKIDCGYEKCASYLYTLEKEEELYQELNALLSLSYPAEIVTKTNLPFEIKCALKFSEQGKFHPLLFLHAIAEHLTIFEQCRVVHVEENRIHTTAGSVLAEHIVFASHYPFMLAPGYYFMRMHQERSYVIAIEGAGRLDDIYLSADENGLSFRTYQNYMLVGGGSHRTGENTEGGRYKFLQENINAMYPNHKEAARWSAQDCMSIDKIPYIGTFSSSQPNWYVATGFGKWGMTNSMTAAKIISGMIAEEEVDYADVFSPQRFHLGASAKSIAENSIEAVKGLTKRFFDIPEQSWKDLPRDFGSIVEYEGEKMGVYRDNEDHFYFVSVKCPHLGCELSWNEDEKSWDCPCHGSRFDYQGKLINGPAQEDVCDDSLSWKE